MNNITVEKNLLTLRTSFAVPVKGNSMEPVYFDGDIVLVQGMADISIGEIGVFTLSGEGYIKKRGADCLISLNPNYDPIPFDESVRCNGKVIGKLEPEWRV